MPKNTREKKECEGHETPDYNGDREYFPNCWICSPTTENGWEESWEKQKLGWLDFCGNEDHDCQCSVKEEAIKTFIHHVAKEEYERGQKDLLNSRPEFNSKNIRVKKDGTLEAALEAPNEETL